jgi:hypothetical protein
MVQGFDEAPRSDVPRAPEHDVEHLAMLVVTGLRVIMVVNGLQVPFGFLGPQFIILILLRVCYTTNCDVVEDGLMECASEGNPGGGGREANPTLSCNPGNIE